MSTLQTTQSEVPAGVIDLGIGHPADTLLPRALLARAAAQRLDQPDASLLQYGLEQGDGYFRRALADFLTPRYGFAVDGDDLFVTCGASLGLDLICTLYTQPGDTIFVEEPTYFLALRVFADHGLRVVSLPTDAEGLVIEALEAALRHDRPALIYVIPTHQNPAGRTLPAARRHKLVELAAEHDFLVVADEVYHLLTYLDAPPPPLAAQSAGGRVLSLGSFSKILAPGLRLGWIQAAPDHVQRLVNSGLLDSGGGLNPFTSGLIRVALEAGWQDEYLDQLHSTYRHRLLAMDRALQAEFGNRITCHTPAGGYFFWIGFDEAVDTAKLMEQAAIHKVGYRPGVRFSSRSGYNNYARLSFAFYEDDQLAEGVARLRAAIDAYR